MIDLIFTPTRVETVLVSSHKTHYVNDEQRIGFQKGVKWLIEQQRIDIEDVTEALKQAKEALDVAARFLRTDFVRDEYGDTPKNVVRQALETINKLGIE